MARTMTFLAAACVAGAAAAFASTAPETPTAPTVTPAPGQPKICKTVVSAEPGTKPYQMCRTKAEWDAKTIADAKDPNRMICHYEEQIGTRFRSNKVCMTAMEWENARQA